MESPQYADPGQLHALVQILSEKHDADRAALQDALDEGVGSEAELQEIRSAAEELSLIAQAAETASRAILDENCGLVGVHIRAPRERERISAFMERTDDLPGALRALASVSRLADEAKSASRAANTTPSAKTVSAALRSASAFRDALAALPEGGRARRSRAARDLGDTLAAVDTSVVSAARALWGQIVTFAETSVEIRVKGARDAAVAARDAGTLRPLIATLGAALGRLAAASLAAQVPLVVSAEAKRQRGVVRVEVDVPPEVLRRGVGGTGPDGGGAAGDRDPHAFTAGAFDLAAMADGVAADTAQTSFAAAASLLDALGDAFAAAVPAGAFGDAGGFVSEALGEACGAAVLRGVSRAAASWLPVGADALADFQSVVGGALLTLRGRLRDSGFLAAVPRSAGGDARINGGGGGDSDSDDGGAPGTGGGGAGGEPAPWGIATRAAEWRAAKRGAAAVLEARQVATECPAPGQEARPTAPAPGRCDIAPLGDVAHVFSPPPLSITSRAVRILAIVRALRGEAAALPEGDPARGTLAASEAEIFRVFAAVARTAGDPAAVDPDPRGPAVTRVLLHNDAVYLSEAAAVWDAPMLLRTAEACLAQGVRLACVDARDAAAEAASECVAAAFGTARARGESSAAAAASAPAAAGTAAVAAGGGGEFERPAAVSAVAEASGRTWDHTRAAASAFTSVAASLSSSTLAAIRKASEGTSAPADARADAENTSPPRSADPAGARDETPGADGDAALSGPAPSRGAAAAAAAAAANSEVDTAVEAFGEDGAGSALRRLLLRQRRVFLSWLAVLPAPVARRCAACVAAEACDELNTAGPRLSGSRDNLAVYIRACDAMWKEELGVPGGAADIVAGWSTFVTLAA